MLKKNLVLIILVALIALLFVSCINGKDYELDIKTPEADLFVEDFMNAVETEDYDVFINTYFTGEEISEVREVLIDISNLVKGSMVRYRKVGFNTERIKYNNKQTTYKQTTYTYIVATNQAEYTLYVNIDEQNGLITRYSFHIYDGGIENLTGYTFGTNPLQIVLLIYSILCYLLIGYAIFICIKSSVRLKAVWIILSLFQSGFLQTIFPSKFSFNIILAKILYSSYTEFPNNGGTILTILFPLMAVVFLINKKKLEYKAEEYRNKKAKKLEQAQTAEKNSPPE